MPYKMGKSGSSHVEYCADCSCSSGKFPQGHRLGRIYGCGDHGVKRSGPSDRIYFMGRSGAEKKAMLNNPKHLILTAPHPSPLSAYRGFSGADRLVKRMSF